MCGDYWEYAVGNLADNSTTVCSGDCVVGNIWNGGSAATSAHTWVLKDGTQSLGTVAASMAQLDGSGAGVIDIFKGTRIRTNLIIDPDDSGTGTLIVQYKKL